MVEGLAKWTRDWRVRVLVPVVAINLAAFGGLYWLMYRYAIENLTNNQQSAATMLLDQIEIDLRDLQVAHDRQLLGARLEQHVVGRPLPIVNVYSADGQPIASTGDGPTETQRTQATVVMAQPNHPSMWTSDETSPVLYGVRAIRNGPSCVRCHGQTVALGAIQLGVEMSGPLASARSRVRRNFAMAGAAWLALLSLMFWAGGVVIGRPLAALEQSITAAGISPAGRRGHDLNALADRVHDSIWSLIRAQKKRDEDIAMHMVRAEQLASLGQLAAGLTHEIKNPLAGVAAALELLREDAESSDARAIHDQMIAELRRVSGTVDALLRLGKPQPPLRTEVDLTRVAREVAVLFRARLKRQGVALDLDMPEAVPPLQLDSGLMVQLLINLLTNAMQATDRGGTITVLVAPFPRHDGVVMAVTDTGRGIPPEHLEHIFDPFFTTKEEGTGLGLAICRQIVEQHGGTMRIESELEKGTRVMVLLPGANEKSEAQDDVIAVAG
jgi:two-component system NtrC family sensor kinase